MTNPPKDPIRLTNRTARALREQAKQQRTALYAFATVMSVLLCALAVILGIQHLIAVPVCVLVAIALDALVILLARGRYLSLTGQAICTEAAARQILSGNVDVKRVSAAARDLQRIKDDLSGAARHDDEEGDEDIAPAKRPRPKPVPIEDHHEEDGEETTRKMEPVTRRRRQARLQVIVSDDSHKTAN